MICSRRSHLTMWMRRDGGEETLQSRCSKGWPLSDDGMVSCLGREGPIFRRLWAIRCQPGQRRLCAAARLRQAGRRHTQRSGHPSSTIYFDMDQVSQDREAVENQGQTQRHWCDKCQRSAIRGRMDRYAVAEHLYHPVVALGVTFHFCTCSRQILQIA